MPAGRLAAELLLGIAAGWRAYLALSDARWIHSRFADYRVWRPQLGWTDPEQQHTRRRWAWFGLASALAVAGSAVAPGWSLAPILAASGSIGIMVWLARDRRLHHGRYTALCITTLACAVVVGRLPAPAVSGLAGTFASLFAAQLYLVAGIRKLRSPHFMSGGVLVDNFVYGSAAAAAGSPDFLRVPSVCRLPNLLIDARFTSVCKTAAWLTALVELAIAGGAIGLLAPPVTISLGTTTHLLFMGLGYRRLLPFSAAAVGLLVLATTGPILWLEL